MYIVHIYICFCNHRISLEELKRTSNKGGRGLVDWMFGAYTLHTLHTFDLGPCEYIAFFFFKEMEGKERERGEKEKQKKENRREGGEKERE